MTKPLPRVPRIEIRDGEVWVCIGSHQTKESLGIIREGEYQKLRDEIAANERKRLAFIMDHMEEFLSWLQWRGNPPGPGQFLDHNPIDWFFEWRNPNAKPSQTSE